MVSVPVTDKMLSAICRRFIVLHLRDSHLHITFVDHKCEFAYSQFCPGYLRGGKSYAFYRRSECYLFWKVIVSYVELHIKAPDYFRDELVITAKHLVGMPLIVLLLMVSSSLLSVHSNVAIVSEGYQVGFKT